MGLKWLITGGCGFIGRNLIRNLMNEGGHYIRVVDNLSVGSKGDLSEVCDFKESQFDEELKSISRNSVDLIVGDILDEKLALDISKEIDIVVHLAGNTGVGPSVEAPRKDCEANVIGTLNYLEASRTNHIQRFIFASSGAPVGEIEPPIHEEIAPHPVSPYGASKLACEGYCSAYFRSYGVNTIALRFGNVYGPYSGRKDSVVAKFIKKILSGHEIEIYGDGSQTRDFIYIDDLIRAIRQAATIQDIGGEIFQIATAKETTVTEISEIIIDTIKARSKYQDIQTCFSAPRIGDVARNFSDTSKARQLLKWESETELKEGIGKTLDWFLAENR